MKKYLAYLFLVVNILATDAYAQKSYYDSLFNVLNSSLVDTVRFGVLMEIGNYLETEDPDSALYFHNKAMMIAEARNDEFMKGYVFKELGGDNNYLSKYDRALEYYSKALAIAERNLKKELPNHLKIKFKKIKAATTGNIGVIYFYQANYTKAVECYFQALKVNEELGRKMLQAENLSNIGAVYYEQADLPKALEYFGKALKLNEAIDDKPNQAINLMNMGSVYFDQKNFDLALDYYTRSQKIDDELENGILTNNFCNIGNVFAAKGDEAKALEYYLRALALNRKKSDRPGECVTLMDIGTLNKRRKNFSEAEHCLKMSRQIAEELHLLDYLKDIDRNLSELYEAMGRDALALKYYKLFIQFSDSVKNEESTRKTIQQEFKYNYEKRFTADSVAFAREKEINEAQIAKQNAQIRARRNQQYAMFGGLGLVLIFSVFIYNRFKVTQKQKAIIQRQKDLVEEKQKEILDSIRYAKRIQRSLLPTERYIEKSLKQEERVSN